MMGYDVYSKSTNKHQHLFHTSCHPKSCKKGIFFGQALRIRLICSSNTSFEKWAGELCNYLVKRSYKKDHVKREIDKARRMPRANTLRDDQPVNNNCIPFVATFHTVLPNIGEILHRLHPVLKSSRRCQ